MPTSELDDAQQRAAYHPGSLLLIQAGPGSGKTRVLVERVAWLVEQVGLPPPAILVSTFTRRTAAELKQRLVTRIGEEQSPEVDTLHGVAHELLRRSLEHWGNPLSIPAPLRICDGGQGARSLARAPWKLGEPLSGVHQRDLYQQLLCHKVSLRPRPAAESGLTPVLLEAYRRRLELAGMLDLADLILRAGDLLERHPEVRERCGWKHLLVDEGQDLDPAQFRLIEGLRGPEGKLTVSADVDQSIYAWRGAEPKLILNFQQRYEDGQVVALQRNYRSSPALVKVATAVISHNQQRAPLQLESAGDDVDQRVSIYHAATLQAEAGVALAWLRGLNPEAAVGAGTAVLARVKERLYYLEELLLLEGVPYQLAGEGLFGRTGVREVLSWLRVLAGEDDPLERVLLDVPRGIGRQDYERLRDFAASQGVSQRHALVDSGLSLPATARGALRSVHQTLQAFQARLRSRSLEGFIKQLARETGLHDWLRLPSPDVNPQPQAALERNWDAFLALVRHRFSGACREQLPQLLGLADSVRRYDPEPFDDQLVAPTSLAPRGVQLLTLHGAKGTEFEAVCILGCDRGVLPHTRAGRAGRAVAVEEERRLFYVGLTRARSTLALCHVRGRSPFIAEIPKPFRRFPRPTAAPAPS
ncbi:MAG: ATP-dependent helicase [Actinomycetota bacterium]